MHSDFNSEHPFQSDPDSGGKPLNDESVSGGSAAPTGWYTSGDGHKSPEYGFQPEGAVNSYTTNLPHNYSPGWMPPHQTYPAGHAYPPPKKKNTVARVIGLSVFAVVLIAAVIMVFYGGQLQYSIPPQVAETESPSNYGGYDFSDYFSNFRSAEITIPRADVGDSVSVALLARPAGDVLSYQDIYKKCSESIVAIKGEVSGMSGYYWGTGIVLTEDGYIITNAHVLEGVSKAKVILANDREFEAKLVGYDTASDLAVLKIDAEGLTSAEFGDSSLSEVGEGVVAIGNPLGEEFRGTMTNGIISAIDRSIDYEGYTMTLMQTDAAINEGNSGGALINLHGHIIGITNMKMSSYYSSIEGIGFAIPSSVIKSVVDEIIKTGYVTGRTSIGISILPISGDPELPDGLHISSVKENGGAYQAGIRAGDVLTAVNGIPVTVSADVTEIKNEHEVGDTLTLTVYRDGEYLDFEVVLIDTGLIY